MKKKIIPLLLLVAVCTNVMAASQSDLPIYYISGRQIDSTGFFYNNYYASLGFTAGQWGGMRYQTVTIVDVNNQNINQTYSSKALSFIPHSTQAFGMQFNLSKKIGYQVGISADQGFFPSDDATLVTPSVNYIAPLHISTYSFFIDNTVYLSAYQGSSFKLAPYVIAGVGLSINNADLQTDSRTPKGTGDDPNNTALDFKPTTSISPAVHFGTGISFYISPTTSFNFGQIVSIGYDFQYNGKLLMNYEPAQQGGSTTKGDSISYNLIQNTIALKYALTF